MNSELIIEISVVSWIRDLFLHAFMTSAGQSNFYSLKKRSKLWMEQNIGYIGTTRYYFKIEGDEEEIFREGLWTKVRLFNKMKKTTAQWKRS